MTRPISSDSAGSSTRPYLIRALHDWCTDNGFTPYVAVYVDATVQVPMEYVKNNEIVLNVGFEATSGLKLGNEFIEFKARFGGAARDIVVPVDHVVAIYARENGQGMAFPTPVEGHGEARGSSGTRQAGGLRLAASEGEEAAGAEPAPRTEGARPGEGGRPPEPPSPPPPGSPRPSLKRIK